MISQHKTSAFNVRRLEPCEWAKAFPVIAQLRNDLDLETYLAHLRRQSYSGYEVVAAHEGERVVGVMGMRPVHTLTRGSYMHIDDLVVDEVLRRSGAGQALMDYAEGDARSRGMSCIFLDARPAAIPFYEAMGYALHTSPSMKKVF